jgi:hypothetical protein
MKRLSNPLAVFFVGVLVGVVANLLTYKPIKRLTPNADLYHKAEGWLLSLPFTRWYARHGLDAEIASLLSGVSLGMGSIVGRAISDLWGGGK